MNLPSLLAVTVLGSNDVISPADLSLQHLVMQADPVVKVVLALLALLSLWCWTVMIEKAVEGAPVVKPRHKTFYGSEEIYVKEPGGNTVGFAKF